MAKGLKCPKCKGHNAYRHLWYENGKLCKRKFCPCGWKSGITRYNISPELYAALNKGV